MNTTTLNKSELQYSINTRNKRDSALTDNWLKNRGITQQHMKDSETLLLQAQKAANELAALHTALIKHQKLEWLQDFATRCKSTRQRKRITLKECYAVLNLQKTVNRQLFKQQRNIH
jgi:hypothetical protein